MPGKLLAEYRWLDSPERSQLLLIEGQLAKKFPDDQLLEQNENYFVWIDGCILNKSEFLRQYNSEWFSVICQMYEQQGELFFQSFRGSFRGFFYDRALDKLLVFNDHLGTKPVFFYQTKDSIIFSTLLNKLIACLRERGEAYELDQHSAYCLLTFGHMLGHRTLISGVLKLDPGHYALISKGSVAYKAYYSVQIKPIEQGSQADLLENVDRLFRQAVRRGFEKDREYGYRHVAALSGGLDSRMTTWVAHDLGYRDIHNITFSESDYWDEQIAKRIAHDLQNAWVFKALDNGLCLYRIEEVMKVVQGLADCFSTPHVKFFFDTFNFDSFGLIHGGQIGDAILGGTLAQKKLRKFMVTDQFLESLSLTEDFLEQDNEINNIYFRGFNYANIGLLSYQEVSEVYSPFMDIDFMEYCLSIPIQLRQGHQLYLKWVSTYYPLAAEYKWEKTGCKITDKKVLFHGKSIFLKQIPALILSKIGYKNKMKTRHHMNPAYYWYERNSELRDFLGHYYQGNIDACKNKELNTACQKLYQQGDLIQKLSVLSLLAFIKVNF